MAKKVEFKVGEFYFTSEGGKEPIYKCTEVFPEPQATMINVATKESITATFSQLANFRRLIPEPRPAHRPKGSKTRKAEAMEKLLADLGEKNRNPEPVLVEAVGITEVKGSVLEQASTPPQSNFLQGNNEGTGAADVLPNGTKQGEEQAQNGTKPLDLSTFDMRVGGVVNPHHIMTIDGITERGKHLKPTLLRLLGEFGFTGSAAEIAANIVLEYPESEGRNLILKILKEGG